MDCSTPLILPQTRIPPYLLFDNRNNKHFPYKIKNHLYRLNLFDLLRMRRLISLLLLTSVHGLYEDQVDTFDWRKDLIGPPAQVMGS